MNVNSFDFDLPSLPSVVSAKMAATTTAVHPIQSPSSVNSDHIEKEPHLTHAQTNISISPELFEKLYLAPKTPHANERVSQYANAVPLGFLG